MALAFTVAPAVQAQNISEEARLYFQNGVELLSEDPPNYQDAYHQFNRAYQHSQSWKVLGNLGLCALKLERDGEALDYYKRYLAEGGSNIDPEEATALKRELLLLEGNLAYATISSDVLDLQVVDKRAGTTIPPQRYRLRDGKLELRLRAGTHTIEARSGDAIQRWEVILDPGQRENRVFSFNAPPAASTGPAAVSAQPQPATPADAPSSSANTPPANDRAGGTLRTIGFVTVGVGAAAVIGGVITGLSAKSSEEEARTFCAGDVCEEQARDKFDSAESMATLTNILFVGGGVLAAAGVTLILVDSPSSESPHAKPALELSPSIAAKSFAFTAQGRF